MESKGYFPLFVDIRDKKILVVGGGNIASRRVKTLTQFCTDITVIAPDIHRELEELEQQKKVRILRRNYNRTDSSGAFMVLAATNDHKLNEEIFSDAKAAGALVNVASNQEKCDFHFPGIVKQDPYVVGINASGADHRGAARLRKQIQEMITGQKEQ